MNDDTYQATYLQSIKDPCTYWRQQAKRLSWFTPFESVQDGTLSQGDIRWFKEGMLNVCYNCLDRHLDTHADKIALLWESDAGDQRREFTYQALHAAVCRMANLLKSLSVQKGDRICIYMPMIPEAIMAMLACARIGAIHTVVFAGFSAQSLAKRIEDAQCNLVITADYTMRGGQAIPLKAKVDEIRPSHVKSTLVVKTQVHKPCAMTTGDLWYHEAIANLPADCPAEPLSAEDPLFILYTSGSTGIPKGVLHSQAGYLLYASVTHAHVFDLKSDDVYWCTADIGWITGHSYVVYGPLANASTVLIYEGLPNYPTASRCWQIIDKYQVSLFYTAPTALRALMKAGDACVTQTSRQSLRVLGSVGEPINPATWQWYHDVVGERRCAVVDTWWQTETGGIMITPLPFSTAVKPGSACQPFFGIVPVLLDESGQPLQGVAEGLLAIEKPWPGMMRTVYQHHERFMRTYLTPYPGYYLTGDKARRDESGYYWITGRVDDVINVSGHRLSTAEIESAIVAHDQVVEAAVVGTPHDIKGQCIVAFVTLFSDVQPDERLKSTLMTHVTAQIGALARPERIIWAEQLPKTRSGKIMRRILRQLAAGAFDALGDTSTLADPSVVAELKKHCQ